MRLVGAVILALAISGQAAAQTQGDRDQSFFKDLDANGDGSIDREEFSLYKGAIFYAMDKNRDLKIERSETRLDADTFRKYAGSDGTIDSLELFDTPGAQFEAFDRNGDQRISREEFRQQLASLRAGPQSAERR